MTQGWIYAVCEFSVRRKKECVLALFSYAICSRQPLYAGMLRISIFNYIKESVKTFELIVILSIPF